MGASCPVTKNRGGPWRACRRGAPILSRAMHVTMDTRCAARANMRRAPAAGPPPGTAVILGTGSGDQVFAEAVLIVGEVADAHEVSVLVVGDLVQTAADASPSGVAERPREEDVPLRLVGPVLPDTGVGARQAGDERVQVAGRLREPLLDELALEDHLPMLAQGGFGGGGQRLGVVGRAHG